MLKLNNSQSRVVAALVERGPLTRRDICSIVDLSWAAVSKIVLHLQNLGLVVNSDSRDATPRGRHPEMIAMNPRSATLGVSINRGMIKAVVLNLAGDILECDSAIIDDGDDPVPEAVKLLKGLRSKSKNTQCFALGVSFPGLIAPSKQEVAFSVNFPEFVERPVAEEFRLALQLDAPVFVERNAVCDLTRQVVAGGITGDAMLISLHSGVSAAVYIDGQILHGQSGNIGELGHLELPDGDIPCVCGKTGCIETRVGGLAWQRSYNKAIRGNREGKPARFADALAEAAPEAIAILQDSLKLLFPVLSELTSLLRPETIVFSADVPESTASIFSTVFRSLFDDECPDIVLAEPYSTAAGAAALGLLWMSGNPHYKI